MSDIAEPTLTSIGEQVELLTDLFKRRLLDDRAKLGVIEDLQMRLDKADAVAKAASLKPLITSLTLVIERLQNAEPSVALSNSIVSELEYVIEAVVQVDVISPERGDVIDGLRHEVTSVSGEGTQLRVDELSRVGYEKDGVVLRPAQVEAIRCDDEGAGPTVESE